MSYKALSRLLTVGMMAAVTACILSVVVLVSLWLSANVLYEYRKSDAIARIEAIGGEVTEYPEGGVRVMIAHPDSFTIPQLPSNLPFALQLGCREAQNGLTDKELEGLTRLNKVDNLALVNTSISDAGLARILGPQLRTLAVINGRITDNGLRVLAADGGMENLTFEGLEITDRGIQNLVGARVKTLDLIGLDITDEGVRYLAAMRLHSLRLCHGNLRGPGLRHLGGIAELRYLDLSHQQITGSGLEELVPITMRYEFFEIDLSYNPIDDDGLRYMRGWKDVWSVVLSNTKIKGPGLSCLPNARYIDLRNTVINDESLRHLPTLRRLEWVYVGGTRVTARGATELQERMPGVHVEGVIRERGDLRRRRVS